MSEGSSRIPRLVLRARKNLQNSEFSEGRLFDKIEWGPPLKTEKLLWVMKKKESKDRMGRLPFYPGYRCQAESRIEGQLPFYLVKKAALEGRLPFYPGKKAKPGIS